MALMTEMAHRPDDVADVLRRGSDQVLGHMKAAVADGAHGIMVADDIAYAQGTFMSPEFVSKHLAPLWKTQVLFARDLGLPVFFHSDGNLNAVLSDIVQAGFDGLQCVEPAAGMDIVQIKAKYGQGLCLMGNLDPSLLSQEGLPGDAGTDSARLRRTVQNLLASAGDGGGFIFGTCSGLHAGMSPERVHLMYRLVDDMDFKSPAAADSHPHSGKVS
jgi:uroporphyrinogen decarboxylase